MPNSRKRRRQSLLRVVDLHQVPLQQSVCQQDVHQVGLLQEPVQQKNPPSTRAQGENEKQAHALVEQDDAVQALHH